MDGCGPGNPAGLGPEDVQRLMAGGPPGAGRWLYPYDGTVFPRGMKPPRLMWDGAAGDVVYVRLRSRSFDYRGCLRTTGPQQLDVPPAVWQRAGERTGGPSDPYTLELTVKGSSGAVGPIVQKIVIAQATLKGSIYYNSYVSEASFGGTIYRIPPGGDAVPFLGGFGCYGCHSVAASGTRLIAHTGGEPGSSYALSPTTQPNPPVLASSPIAGFAGLSPDGSVYASTAHPAGNVRPQGTPNESLLVNDAALVQTDSGMAIAGSGIPAGAMMNMFSPDGRQLAFNDFGVSAGKALAVMSYDAASRKLSNHRVVYTDPDRYPGWPFFLPDGRALVFARGVNPTFSGAGAGVIGGIPFAGPESDLHIVDLQTGKSTILAQAMGMKSPVDPTGITPFGPADLHQHYYPTVSPVAAGGYFWVFFDSIRNYGNLGVARQLWGTAITIAPDGRYEGDPSHPAFFVSGQIFGSGNHRAFTALDACRMDGDKCTSGIDCCGGFCHIDDSVPAEFADPVGTCSPTMRECARRDERCVTSDDCCRPAGSSEPPSSCIAGFCAPVRGPD
ncbi:MAG TPA: hypothetical protein VJV78_13160 [Polyangiales bacterium]|nr:hypothetical protein [Polyangiales bacterium]